jgi:hypothetical protein
MLNLDKLQRIHDEAFKGYDDVHEWAVAAACWRDSILEHGAAMLAELRAGRDLRAAIVASDNAELEHVRAVRALRDKTACTEDAFLAARRGLFGALAAYDEAVL